MLIRGFVLCALAACWRGSSETRTPSPEAATFYYDAFVAKQKLETLLDATNIATVLPEMIDRPLVEVDSDAVRVSTLQPQQARAAVPHWLSTIRTRVQCNIIEAMFQCYAFTESGPRFIAGICHRSSPGYAARDFRIVQVAFYTKPPSEADVEKVRTSQPNC